MSGVICANFEAFLVEETPLPAAKFMVFEELPVFLTFLTTFLVLVEIV